MAIQVWRRQRLLLGTVLAAFTILVVASALRPQQASANPVAILIKFAKLVVTLHNTKEIMTSLSGLSQIRDQLLQFVPCPALNPLCTSKESLEKKRAAEEIRLRMAMVPEQVMTGLIRFDAATWSLDTKYAQAEKLGSDWLAPPQECFALGLKCKDVSRSEVKAKMAQVGKEIAVLEDDRGQTLLRLRSSLASDAGIEVREIDLGGLLSSPEGRKMLDIAILIAGSRSVAAEVEKIRTKSSVEGPEIKEAATKQAIRQQLVLLNLTLDAYGGFSAAYEGWLAKLEALVADYTKQESETRVKQNAATDSNKKQFEEQADALARLRGEFDKYRKLMATNRGSILAAKKRVGEELDLLEGKMKIAAGERELDRNVRTSAAATVLINRLIELPAFYSLGSETKISAIAQSRLRTP